MGGSRNDKGGKALSKFIGQRTLYIALTALSLTVGLLLAYLGIVGDTRDWWNSRPFLTNLLTAFTGVFFGVPFVILILQRISSAQADREQWRRIDRLNRLGIGEFVTAIRSSFRSGNAIRQVQYVADELQGVLRAIAKATEGRSDMGPQQQDSPWPLVDTLHNANRSISMLLPPEEEAIAAWRNMEARWAFLDTFVRPRVLESDQQWLSSWMYIGLHISFGNNSFPFDASYRLQQTKMLGKFAERLTQYGLAEAISAYGESGVVSVINSAIAELQKAAERLLYAEYLERHLESSVPLSEPEPPPDALRRRHVHDKLESALLDQFDSSWGFWFGSVLGDGCVDIYVYHEPDEATVAKIHYIADDYNVKAQIHNVEMLEELEEIVSNKGLITKFDGSFE